MGLAMAAIALMVFHPFLAKEEGAETTVPVEQQGDRPVPSQAGAGVEKIEFHLAKTRRGCLNLLNALKKPNIPHEGDWDIRLVQITLNPTQGTQFPWICRFAGRDAKPDYFHPRWHDLARRNIAWRNVRRFEPANPIHPY